MRILHLCTDFWPNIGGIEKFVLELSRYSRKAGMEVRILALDRTAQHRQKLPADDRVEGFAIHRVPFLDLRYYKPTVLPLSDLAWADVLHVHGTSALLDFAALTQGAHHRPIVVSTHGGIFHTSTLRRVKEFYFRVLERPIHKRVDRYVACSQGDFELFSQISGRVTLLENGVDLSRFGSINQAVPRKTTFLSVGRIAANKRLDHLLQALSKLRAMGEDFTARIVGPDTDGLTGHLQTLSNGLGLCGRVVFTGAIDEELLMREYQQARFFISASDHEGFGISAVEAMAGGCIPVLNDIPAFRHLLGDATGGVLTDFGNAELAAQKLREMLRQDDESMRAAAGARAQQFSWEARMPQWISIYRSAAGAR